MAAVPSIGRATRVERPVAPGADAAGDLYERYSAQIFGYCLHQLGSREEAEDAVQTTFMNAFRGLSRGIVPELESAWLFKIAQNVCLSRRRSSWRRGKIEAPNNFEVLQEVIPGREQPVADELIRLQDVLEEMPENQRRAILLREWQGLTYREISAELGLTQAAVETLIFRARRALAQGLEQDADTWKRRLRRGADVGGAIACIKALLGGGGAAAVKVAATALAIAGATVAATTTATAPRHPHHARGTTKHATTAHVARQIVSTSALGSDTHTQATRWTPARTGDARKRTPNTPASPASPAPKPDTSTGSADVVTTGTLTAAPPQSAPTQPESAPPVPATPPTPASPSGGPGNGKGKSKKEERSPQASTQSTDTAAAPIPAPAEPPAENPAADAPGQDTAANPGNGNGHGNARRQSDK